MFQTFETSAAPEQGPPRIAALRAALAAAGFAGVLVPRADAHQGEYVAPCDARLAWLTGFTGSAGMAVVTKDRAGLFVDGRYRVQARTEVDTAVLTPVNWPETKPGTWLRDALPHGGRVAYDPWLHTRDEIDALEKSLEGSSVSLIPESNFIDPLWPDRPPPPAAPVTIFPDAVAGTSAAEKRAAAGRALAEAGQDAAVLTLPDGINWLLNIRGGDIPRNPVAQCTAILRADGSVTLFIDPAKLSDDVRGHLGSEVSVAPPGAFAAALSALRGTVRVDRATAPVAVSARIAESGATAAWERDPTVLPKARKTAAELAATAEAHLRDGATMVEFLAWLDATAPQGGLTEIDVVRRLEGFRRATNALKEISFDTICGAGPHGAIVHYRVTEATNRPVRPGELLLVDSGGQYLDGTTDITRTVAIGPAGADERRCFTRVLQGMIAVSRLRWPKGLEGRHLDAVARYPLWIAGQDYDHGTGHGVGVYLSVHEGPQRLARTSDVPLEPGMILSNEPGYYREGAFGIRLENLVVVEPAPPLPGADAREMLAFRTLTFAPIDRRLVDAGALSAEERAWLDAYHAEVRAKIGPRVSEPARAWLQGATAPI
ncbi:MAG: aminopeptidase P family protein [Rhodobacteraceae bacterium]|nr:aminopeptidase P family protein [Paracoccaceae bacterium]